MKYTYYTRRGIWLCYFTRKLYLHSPPALENTTIFVKYLAIFHSYSCNKLHLYIYVCGRKKYLNRTLEIDSPFQTLTVGLLVEFID